MKKDSDTLFRIVYTVLFTLALILLIVLLRDQSFLEKAEAIASQNWVIATLLILSLYVFRAFIPLFPSFALYALSGRLFWQKGLPFFISLIGTVLLLVLSYILGRMKKHNRKVRVFRFIYDVREEIFERTSLALRNGNRKALLIFALSLFPIKMLGRICGKIRFPFLSYLGFTVLGSLPSVISATLLGKSLGDADSPFFIFSLFLTVAVIVISTLIFQKNNYKEIYNDEKSN